MFSVPAATTTAPASTRRAAPSTVDVLDARRLAVLDQHALDARVGAQLELARRPRVVDVGVQRRLAGVRRAALEARAAAHAVRVGVRPNRLERRTELAERRFHRPHALAPVGALADAEPLLDAVVVRRRGRIELNSQTARLFPLRVVLCVRAERHLRVDRRRAADAAPAEQRHCAARAAVDQREADRPPEVVLRLRLPAREVGGGLVRPGLEQQHVPAALGELAGDHAAARTRADDDDVEAFVHEMPRYDQSFASRVASGVLKSISSQAPLASTPGATKSL